MQPKETKLLQVQDLCIQYCRADSCVINHLSFDVLEGEILCLHGRSGAGKVRLYGQLPGCFRTMDIFGIMVLICCIVPKKNGRSSAGKKLR